MILTNLIYRTIKKNCIKLMKSSNNILHFYCVKKTIGDHIKEERINSGMSIAEFARRINKSPQNVHDIFDRTSLDTDLLMKIGEVLKHDFFTHFTSTNTEKSSPRKYRVTIQVDIDDLDIADKILKMTLGDEGFKQLNK